MTLTIEEKEEYVELIDFIWSGSMQNNTVDNITEDIADDMAFLLSEIKTCSNNLQLLKSMFEDIYKPGMVWRTLIKNTAMQPAKKGYTKRWAKKIKENKIYKVCVDTGALNWKSHIQIKLMGE